MILTCIQHITVEFLLNVQCYVKSLHVFSLSLSLTHSLFPKGDWMEQAG